MPGQRPNRLQTKVFDESERVAQFCDIHHRRRRRLPGDEGPRDEEVAAGRVRQGERDPGGGDRDGLQEVQEPRTLQREWGQAAHLFGGDGLQNMDLGEPQLYVRFSRQGCAPNAGGASTAFCFS